jgi:hypothetical protein
MISYKEFIEVIVTPENIEELKKQQWTKPIKVGDTVRVFTPIKYEFKPYS